MSAFHPLKVDEITKESPNCVSITLSTEGVENEFHFNPGQYLTFDINLKGEQIRRAYSICSGQDEKLRVAVKEVDNGRVSVFLNQSLMAGDVLRTMTPQGHFALDQHSESEHHFFVGGSGITPILSMIKSLKGKNNKANLYYASRDEENCVFHEELKALEQEIENLNVQHFFSRSEGNRLDKAKIEELLADIKNPNNQHFYLCGPDGLMAEAKSVIQSKSVSADNIHMEYFSAPVEDEDFHVDDNEGLFSGEAKIEIILDDESESFNLSSEGDSLLDAALDEGLDAPFSCKGGVCTSCRAKVLKGKVHMDANYALSDDEMEDGYILTCQGHPASAEVCISFDD